MNVVPKAQSVRNNRILWAHPAFMYQSRLQPFYPIVKHFTLSIKKQSIISSKNWMLGIQATCQLPWEIDTWSFSTCLGPALFSNQLSLKGSTSEQGRKWDLKCHWFLRPSSFYFSCLCPEKKNMHQGVRSWLGLSERHAEGKAM